MIIGTILNAAGILLGGILGLTLRKALSPPRQAALKGLLGVLTVYVGLKLTWMSLGGGMGQIARRLAIVLMALILGRITGRLLHLQTFLNRLGQHARKSINQASAGTPQRFADGFITCALLYCSAPMALLGALLDGLQGHWQTLGIKALIDGLAMMSFVVIFGWGAILSLVPVVAYQGTLALGAGWVAPWLGDHDLLDSLNATGGLLVFCVALIILELKKIELTDYLPSLVFAPLITWLWR